MKFEEIRSSKLYKEWIKPLFIALLIALFIRTLFVQAYKIPTGSMRPTLKEGDRILVSKLNYGPRIPFIGVRLPGFTKPERADVVVFIYPEDKDKNFIKRLIAMGGEAVEIRNGNIYIDDRLVTDPVVGEKVYYNRGPFGEDNKKITVPEGNYFVLGDNSSSSKDSRYWGFVPEKDIIGRAIIIYWPPRRIGLVK